MKNQLKILGLCFSLLFACTSPESVNWNKKAAAPNHQKDTVLTELQIQEILNRYIQDRENGINHAQYFSTDYQVLKLIKDKQHESLIQLDSKLKEQKQDNITPLLYRLLEEPDLTQKQPGRAIRIFIWTALAHFENEIISIRTTKDGIIANHISFMPKNSDCIPFGNIPLTKDCLQFGKNIQKQISKTQFDSLFQLTNDLDLHYQIHRIEKRCLHGDSFFLEVLDNKHQGEEYYSLQRTCPGAKAPIRTLYQAMLDLLK